MEAGKSYALVIQNFSKSGNGFSIEFGGTGTFLGPEPNLVYSTTEACVGESVTFQDQSTSVDGIAAWEWDFGPTATPRTATGAGPHEVAFSDTGSPNVVLAITSTRNCIEYITVSDVNVICCNDQLAGSAEIAPVSCPGSSDGRIAFTVSGNNAGAELTYSWSNGATTATVEDLDIGTYTLTLDDGSGCLYIDSFTVVGPQPYVFDTLITQPGCNGATDGALDFRIVSGGAGGYEYSFNGSPYSPESLFENVASGTVNVIARDANGCTEEQDILVDELRLELLEGTPGFIEPTCNGGLDGQLDIQIANGQPNYQYDFGDGLQPQPRQGGFGAGTYSVRAIDATGCTGEFTIDVTEPPVLELNLRADSSSCFGADDASIFATAGGGRPGYSFAWTDGVTGNERLDLSAGIYVLNMTDSVGCTVTDSVVLIDPEEIIASIDTLQNLICSNVPQGSFTLSATGGSPDYTYSSDGINFQSSPVLDSLFAEEYTLYVRDQNGCVDSLTGTLTQPLDFDIRLSTFLDSDITVRLGDDTTLTVRSNYGPLTYSWGPDSVQCLNADCSRVRILPLRSLDYFVTAVNEAGCVDTASVAFLVIEDLPTYIPNVISPNGDENNDYFTVFGGRALANVEVLRIFDRWGSLLYENAAPFPANNARLGWDGTIGGKPVNAGVYVYYTEVSYINGRREGYRGDVTVVR